MAGQSLKWMNTMAIRTASLMAMIIVMSQSASAQMPQRGYQPLHHMASPGTAGLWAERLGRACPGYWQTIELTTLEGGSVSYYDEASSAINTVSGAKVELQVAAVYRLKLSDLPDYPGVELYPTIEVIDRLHPPAHLKHEFPIPIVVTEADIEAALRDELVTKVIYLDQPEIAATVAPYDGGMRSETLPSYRNLLAEADERGRPLLIFRMGRRVPSLHDQQRFLTSGGPVRLVESQDVMLPELSQSR